MVASVVSTFKSNAVCVAVDIGLFASLVLSTFPNPTCVWVTAWGFAKSASWLLISVWTTPIAVDCAVLTGLSTSLVLSTFGNSKVTWLISETLALFVAVSLSIVSKLTACVTDINPTLVESTLGYVIFELFVVISDACAGVIPTFAVFKLTAEVKSVFWTLPNPTCVLVTEWGFVVFVKWLRRLVPFVVIQVTALS